MKKVVGLIVSPRNLGNCELVVKEVSKNIPEKHKLFLLRLSDYDLKPCKGCYKCLFGEGKCRINDDFYKILNTVAEADGIILAVPTYFYSAKANLKLFLDRCLAAYPYIDRLWRKPSIGIGIAGIHGLDGHTLLDIQNFLKLIFSDIKASKIFYGALPGEVLLSDENKNQIIELGKFLFGKAADVNLPICPLCGGSFFQFIGEQDVKCMLCSNPGVLKIKNGLPYFEIVNKRDIYFSRESALNHREWLKNMRAKFLEKREELKKVGNNYINEGDWVKNI